MLHHLSFGVADIERACAFYDAVLAPLGYVRVWQDLRPGEAGQAVGYGLPGGGDKLALKLRPEGPVSYTHLDVYKRQVVPTPRRSSITVSGLSGQLTQQPASIACASEKTWSPTQAVGR